MQETQKVVADLDNNFTKLEDDIELRVDEILSPCWIVPRSFWSGPGTICQEPGAME